MQNLVAIILLLLLSACASHQEPRAPSTSIAILMPLSGPQASLGKRCAGMIEMGLDEGLSGNIKIHTYDVFDQERADKAIAQVIASNTKLVLGPIFSNSAAYIADRLKEHNVTMFTLSNNPALAADNLLVFGHAPLRQTIHALNYSLDKGYKSYLMMLPANNFSRELIKTAEPTILAKGGKLMLSEFYANTPESIAIAVTNVANMVENINENDELSKPVIYLSDDAEALNQIMPLLKKHNLDVTAIIIGDNKIDSRSYSDIPIYFTGGWDGQFSALQLRASSIMRLDHLNYMDILAYDLGKIVASNLRDDTTIDQFLLRLKNQGSHYGYSGEISFINNIAVRKYSILKHFGANYQLIEK